MHTKYYNIWLITKTIIASIALLRGIWSRFFSLPTPSTPTTIVLIPPLHSSMHAPQRQAIRDALLAITAIIPHDQPWGGLFLHPDGKVAWAPSYDHTGIKQILKTTIPPSATLTTHQEIDFAWEKTIATFPSSRPRLILTPELITQRADYKPQILNTIPYLIGIICVPTTLLCPTNIDKPRAGVQYVTIQPQKPDLGLGRYFGKLQNKSATTKSYWQYGILGAAILLLL